MQNTKGEPLADLRGRLTKGAQYRSAFEEILLARGLVCIFGADAVKAYPKIANSNKRAEFLVRHSECEFVVEATGLSSPAEEKLLNEAILAGDYAFFDNAPPSIEMGRFCEKLATKASERYLDLPLLLCISQHSFRPLPDKSKNIIRTFVSEPHRFSIPSNIRVLGVAFSVGFFAQGVYFSQAELGRYSACDNIQRCIENAISQSFLPRTDGSIDSESI